VVDSIRERDDSPVFGAQRASEAGGRSVVEPIDNRAGEPREFHQRRFHWSARNYIDIVERYLNSDLDLVVRIGDVARQHVAVLRSLTPIERIQFGWQGTESVMETPASWAKKARRR
jgi:hypothetical protein